MEKYSYLYDDKRERDIPRQPRDMNTTITRLKKLQAFFNELEDKEEIMASPFRKSREEEEGYRPERTL